MSETPENIIQPIARGGMGRDLSPIAQNCALWMRFFARAVKMTRLYRSADGAASESRSLVWEQLTRLLQDHGKWELRIFPGDIRLDEELVVKTSSREQLESGIIPGPEEALPFTLYRDGVRGITMLPKLSRQEFDALFDAIVIVGRGANSQDDLVTLLWQANLRNLVIDSVPLEQTIYLSSRKPPKNTRRGFRGQSFVWNPSGSEIRGDLGATDGPQGLHRDTFDDWRLPDVVAQSVQAYQALLPQVEAAKGPFLESWEKENRASWHAPLSPMFHGVLGLSPDDETRRALAISVASWLADAIQRAEWDEARDAFTLLHELDADGSLSRERLAILLEELEVDPIAEALDEANHDEHAAFSALLTVIGPVAIPLAFDAMSLCTRARSRAAGCAALSYLCADDPRALSPLIDSEHWFVVRNAVFVLGQIGGPEIVDMLRRASLHHEPRVRREVVRACGAVSRAERTPILIPYLESKDSQLLASTLHMLTRERHERVDDAIVERIERDDFDDLPEESQRAFLLVLSEISSERTVPALERMLLKLSGLFARHTLWRDAAARILFRLASDRSLAVLEAGLQSKSEPVRTACLAAMSSGKAAA
jgi:hypothetical protein